MDEPFGALDPATRLKMQELLVHLWSEAQATVFFVTHSIEEAVYLGDRVYVFSPAPGTLVREVPAPKPEGSPQDMQNQRPFMDLVAELRETLQKLETHVSDAVD